ncbi:hypothetical protein KFK09_021098 [Dendrobium nobile]|uniref:Pentatricopeptide repeat-containing protein n=1 Tax=Dendrobium nobile TaxID=94219 RepID=A0A8T3AP15_DENNO|nr:hypothetical protein KFK09_021098 [Dendrobium nobile]
MWVLLKIARHQQTWASLPFFKFSPRKILAIYHRYGDFSNAVYSPELPHWFRFAEGEQDCDLDSEDDFLLPTRSGSSEGSRGSRKAVVRIEHSEAVDVDVDQISNVLKARFSSPEEVVSTVNNYSPKVSKDLVDKILKRFSNEWIPALGFFRWADARMGYKHSRDSYDMMVDILGKSKQFDTMWGLVEEMSRIGGLISLSTITKVIRRLAGAARWKEAIRAFHGMVKFGISKDTVAMNILLDSLCKERSVMRARYAFLDLRREIAPNASSFNILIHGWCKARKLEEAWQTLEEMIEFGFKPCVITYTSLIEAYCMERDFQKVEAVLDEMRTQGCQPNVITYTIIMHSFGKVKETLAAFFVLDQMKTDGCLPDASVYNSLIYIFARAGQLREAYNVYEEMHKREIFPNVTTFNTLISAACNHSQADHALKLLVKMDETSCKPDIKTYTPLLKLSCARKWMRVLLYLLGHMFKRDISLDLGTYTLLVRGLCRTGKLKQACIFYEEMILKGFIPRSHSSAILLEALERKNMVAAKSRVQKLTLKAQNMRQLTHYTDQYASD